MWGTDWLHWKQLQQGTKGRHCPHLRFTAWSSPFMWVFPEATWQSPGAPIREFFHINGRSSQLGLDLLEQGAVFTTCRRWGRLLWEFRPNNTLHSSREGITGREVKRKKNPSIVNDAAWSDFDKATMNKIETTWANESPGESSPICLWQLWWVGKEKS